mmetsp:Transcript_15673/g.37769  ORF Transcript_15673/g.37769 Transcript_15673/m.37769 type:complete len:245 (+) Transcript_15673:158-892(+)
MAEEMTVTFKVSGGSTFELKVTPQATVKEMKEMVNQKLVEANSALTVSQLRLLVKGKILDTDEKTIGECGVKQGSTIFMVKGANAGPSKPAPAAAAPSAAAAASAPEAPAAQSTLCLGKCGFYGDPKKDGLCSKCFLDRQKKVQADLERLARETKKEKDADADKKEAEEEETKVERKEQENKSRCWECNKKIGLTGFQCRCEYYFCGAHRYAEAHNCDFDHQKFHRKVLEKQNQVVSGTKIEKV